MRRNRPFAALLAFALSLQLMLAGKGETCVGQPIDSHRMGMASSGSAMSDMGVAGGVADQGYRHEGSGSAEDRQSGEAPCDQSPAATSCQFFASCAAGFVPTEPSDELLRQERPASPRLTSVPLLASRTIAPELPPPRA